VTARFSLVGQKADGDQGAEGIAIRIQQQKLRPQGALAQPEHLALAGAEAGHHQGRFEAEARHFTAQGITSGLR
jgi:hypothetical protein